MLGDTSANSLCTRTLKLYVVASTVASPTFTTETDESNIKIENGVVKVDRNKKYDTKYAVRIENPGGIVDSAWNVVNISCSAVTITADSTLYKTFTTNIPLADPGINTIGTVAFTSTSTEITCPLTWTLTATHAAVTLDTNSK